MGWFWANDRNSISDGPAANDVNTAPPKSKEPLVSALWTSRGDIWSSNTPEVNDSQAITTPSKCPVDHTKLNWSKGKPKMTEGGSPSSQVDHSMLRGPNDASSNFQQTPHGSLGASSSSDVSQCPIDHTKMSPDDLKRFDHSSAKFNTLNNMPQLPATRLPGQIVDLPTERTRSSIPRGDAAHDGFWEYPSPQQMLNAMVRKSGREGIDEEAVESMVDVHNFLNEGVWNEVLEWERPYTAQSSVKPRLERFQGRPGDMSPRARILQAMGWVYPAKYGVPPPFDRHDWTVLRGVPGKPNEWQKVRYVIDFYEIPDVTDDDVPTFTVDVRPAADSFGNVYARVRKSWGPIVGKALGWE